MFNQSISSHRFGARPYISYAVSWNTGGSIHKGPDIVWISWWVIVTEFDSQAALTKLSALLMETTDWSS